MKTVKIGKIKNLFIVALTVAAVYQTATLWLENYSGHNFFYSFFTEAGQTRNTKAMPAIAIDAEKAIVGYGNKTFSVTYPGLGENELTLKTNAFTMDMFKGGATTTLTEIPFEEIISQRCVILDFAFGVSASQYFQGIGGVNEEETGISSINQIIAVPGLTKADESNLYIVDQVENKICQVTLSGVEGSEPLNEALKNFENLNTENLRYISTKQNGFNIFKSNVFVPQWSQNSYQYATITEQESVFRFGSNAIASIENSTSSFFADYSVKTVGKDAANIYTVSDDDVVVKYYPEKILEYYNYAKKENVGEQTLSTAYYVCKEFLNKDKSLNTKVFLADVELKSNGLVFSFDYSINDMPIYFNQTLKEKLGMNHAIEVFIENNTVKKYRRYAEDFVLAPTKEKTVNIEFVGAMNQVIAQEKNQVTAIEDLVLGYCLGEEGEIGLKWFTSVDDKRYITDTVTAQGQQTQ